MIKTKKQTKRRARPRKQTVGQVLTLVEAANYLRLGQDDVLRLITEQGLPARRLGNQWRLLKSAINKWLRIAEIITSVPKFSRKHASQERRTHCTVRQIREPGGAVVDGCNAFTRISFTATDDHCAARMHTWPGYLAQWS